MSNDKYSAQVGLLVGKEKKLNFEKLITETVSFDNYNNIYDDINNSDSIASILEYSSNISDLKKIDFKTFNMTQSDCVVGVGYQYHCSDIYHRYLGRH